VSDPKQPSTDEKPTLAALAARAMDRVLDSELSARQAVERCEQECAASLERARAEARRILERAHARAVVIHARADRALQSLAASEAAEGGARTAAADEFVDLTRLRLALERLAVRLMQTREPP